MPELKKEITLWKGIALAVSMVIGSGLLGLPGLALEMGSVHSNAGAWLLISVALIPLIYIFATLGIKFTSSAGLSKYAEESLGSFGNYAVSAVLCGTFVFGIPVLVLIGADYARTLLSLPQGSIVWLAIAILTLSTIGNLLGVKVVNIINTASLIALVGISVVIILSNIPFLKSGLLIFGETVSGKGDIKYNDLWHISALLFWAFIGWENLSFSLEEFKHPQKSIPRVYWLSFIIVIFLYMSLTITSIGAQASGVPIKGASGLAFLIGQTPMGFFQMAVMVLVIPANANAWVLGASRLYYASGRDHILPSFLSHLSKNGIPLNSLAVSFMIYTLVILITRLFKIPYSLLVLLVSQNFLVLYAFSIFAYWKTERGINRWVVTLSASISCGFLLSGFTWWVVYPLCLLTIGYAGYHRSNRQCK
jgi:amino acid transporter